MAITSSDLPDRHVELAVNRPNQKFRSPLKARRYQILPPVAASERLANSSLNVSAKPPFYLGGPYNSSARFRDISLLLDVRLRALVRSVTLMLLGKRDKSISTL